MTVKQLSVFIENKSGRLADVMRYLAENAVNIRALSIADTSDFGILRLIVDDPDMGLGVLKAQGFAVNETEVLAVAIPDRPGGLADILGMLKSASVDIEYMYAFVGKANGMAVVVFRTENADLAAKVLTAGGVTVLTGQEIYA